MSNEKSPISAVDGVFQTSAVLIEMPRAWSSRVLDQDGKPLTNRSQAGQITDSIKEIGAVCSVYAVADDAHVPHQGLHIIKLAKGAYAESVKREVERIVTDVTRPRYDEKALFQPVHRPLDPHDAGAARVSTALIQTNKPHFPFDKRVTQFAATYLNSLRDRENPLGEGARLLEAFDAQAAGSRPTLAVIHQNVQTGIDPETEEPKGFSIIRGMITLYGGMANVKGRFHDAARSSIGATAYSAFEPQMVGVS